jgi:Pentapeptide repeats (9 copies)
VAQPVTPTRETLYSSAQHYGPSHSEQCSDCSWATGSLLAVRQVIVVAIYGTLIALALAVLVWILPPRLMVWPYTGVSITAPGVLPIFDVLKAQNDLRHSLVETFQFIATVLTAAVLVVTLYFTNANLRIAQENSRQSVEASERTLEAQRQSRLGERFSEAVEQLGNDETAVRVGAIYALARIASESSKDYWPVAHLLCSFLRGKRPVEQEAGHPAIAAPPDDAKAVAAFLRMGLGKYGGVIDLSMTNLHGLDLTGGVFGNANFNGAKLDGVVLVRTMLIGATFANVTATHADFTDAQLAESFMNGMDLTAARLTRADLRGASVTKAKVRLVFGPILNVTQEQKDSAEGGVWEELST